MEQAVYSFCLKGEPVECTPFGHGHINSTFQIVTDQGAAYVLQRINTYVFKDPVGLMENAGAVTDYIRARVDDPRRALHFLTTKDGKYCHEDEQGEFWRMYEFVDGFCLDAPETDEDFYQSAVAFGQFQQLLSEFPADTLVETIPNFHNTVDRYRQFRESVEADKAGRLQSVRADVDFLLEREEMASKLQNMRENGILPLRVTHNDTKLNNVLLDKDTRKPLCVLDLDTVMPGLSAYDFGDSIRFGAATAAEDEPDLSKMEMDLHLFEVYVRGFLAGATNLTDEEVKALPLGAYTITLEQATRFLKDHLDGDVYFKVAYPEHNLVRARTQIKLVADMEKKLDEMNAIVEKIAAELRK
ncbi:MAG: aminoglycoside phosphotransferase family protein [Oscillospiraceae bacterium]|nr:aminoglycoside phosphotransferase family protein [Oscillospiraceae bacterium]